MASNATTSPEIPGSPGGAAAAGRIVAEAELDAAAGVAVEPALRAARARGRKLLVTYATGGLGPDWVDYLQVMVENGADLVEIGLPFSDPVMDGPTIQAASVRALEAGANPLSILDAVARREQPVPLVAMTYYNLVFRAGHERFARMLSDAGVRGAIIPDLPLEESGGSSSGGSSSGGSSSGGSSSGGSSGGWEEAAAAGGVETVLLAAPVTPDARLVELCRRSHGFVYGVNLMGVTGERAGTVAGSGGVLAKRLKAVTDKPVIMGFGISTPDQAVAAAGDADGVVVASALMRAVMEGASVAAVGRLVAGFRAALDRG